MSSATDDTSTPDNPAIRTAIVREISSSCSTVTACIAVTIGMSRLFSACRGLAAEDPEDWSAVPTRLGRPGMSDVTLPFDADDDVVEELLRGHREFLPDWHVPATAAVLRGP